MSNQHSLIALDWLMPVLQDVFDDLMCLLQQSDSPNNKVDWVVIEQKLHQVSGTLSLALQPMLANLASTLEKTGKKIAKGELAKNHQADMTQSVVLLWYELKQFQYTQQLHVHWLIDRINFFKELLGEEPLPTHHQASKEQERLLKQLKLPEIAYNPIELDQHELIKLWRYHILQLLYSNKNQPDALKVLMDTANILAQSELNGNYQQLWQVVVIWLESQALNDEPTPHHYVYLLDLLDNLILKKQLSKALVGRFIVDILLKISQLNHKTSLAQSLIEPLNLKDFSEDNTLFTQVLNQLEQVIYQLDNLAWVLPKLKEIQVLLKNRGWTFYHDQIEQVIFDVQLMVDNPEMMGILNWQIERQLQDVYRHMLEAVDTLERKVGAMQIVNSQNPDRETLRQTRINIENIKLAFNDYSQSNDVTSLNIQQDFVEMTQVFDTLGLFQPKELSIQLSELFQKLIDNSIQVLSWETTDVLAETIAQFELFLDYLSYQNMNNDLLNQIQQQLHTATTLVNELIHHPILPQDIVSRDKDFQPNTIVYDDEGKKLIANDKSMNIIDNQPEENSIIHADDLMIDNQQALKAIVVNEELLPITTENPILDTADVKEIVLDDVHLNDDLIEPIQSIVVEQIAVEDEELIKARLLLKADDYDIDDEIREIFIEEAEEVLTNMQQPLAEWQANPEDLVVLKEVRRGFHTLKGSGRMVGANQLGETAWAVENMLNRVLDNTIEVTPNIVEFINDTYAKIPILVEDFAKQQSPSLDPAFIIRQANILLQNPYASHQTPVVAQNAQPAVDVIDNPPVETLEKSQIAVTTLDNALPISVLETLQSLQKVSDGESDPDIKEIYIEEADEVLTDLTTLYRDTWRHDPEDMETLKEIRRGFHTLKGSGRMVGANQLGELAWAVESMLNRILEHKIDISLDMADFIGDVIENFAELVTIFAENRTNYPEKMYIWQATADAYAHGLGNTFNYQDIQQFVQANIPQTQQTTTTETATVQHSVDLPIVQEITTTSTNAVTSDDIDIFDSLIQQHLATETLTTEPASISETTNNDQTHTDTTSNENDVIVQIFIEEANDLFDKIDKFIETNRQQDYIYVSDELVRAFHTLRGGAGLANLPRIYALSTALENNLDELLRQEIPLNNKQLDIVANAKNDLISYIQDYQQHRTTQSQPDDDSKIAHLSKNLLESCHLDSSKALSVNELMTLGVDDLLDVDGELQIKLATEDKQQLQSHITKLEEQASKLLEAVKETKFVNLVQALQYAYRIINKYPQLSKDEDIVDVLLQTHYQLTGIFDTIAAGMNVSYDDTIVNFLHQVFEEKLYNLKMSLITYEPVHTDAELLDIFLEEALAIDQLIAKTFSQWENNLSNIDALTELHRYLNAIKGGASMVGLQSISEIASYAETLYQALENGKLSINSDICNIMQQVQDTLSAQLDYLQKNHQSFYAKDLEQELANILTTGKIPTDLTMSLPLLVIEKLENYTQDSTNPDGIASDNLAENVPLYSQDIINNFEQRRLETWNGQEPDDDILAVYLEEAKELVDSSSEHLQEFRNNNHDGTALQALQRELHTIKGGARMVGAEGLATLAHEMESVYEELGSHRKPATRMIGNLLASCHDWIASALYVLENKYNPQKPVALVSALQHFSKDPDSLKTIPQDSLAGQIEQIKSHQNNQNTNQQNAVRDISVMPSMQGNFEEELDQTNHNTEMVRISANLMEQMINLSRESSINRARIDMGISGLTNTIEEMGVTVQRLADQLRRMETELEVQILAKIDDDILQDAEFDPLEMDQYSSLNQLSKSLSESASDLLDIKTTMLDKTRDTENLLLQLSRTQSELQEGLMGSRTVPFSRVTPRLQRIVRQTATELNKSVELRIINDESEVDRNILDHITSPLEHMLRNAIDHGIEKTQERIASGKQRTGLITLEVLREGGEIVIHLIDDGKGINIDAVRKKAVERGLIASDDTTLKPLDIMQYIFNAGLSTATSVTQVSGRGVGMDVVQSEVKQLGGVVSVDSEQGKGSRFTIRLPMAVSASDALIVRAGDKNFAIPLVQIERVVRINAETIFNFHNSNSNDFDIDGQSYRLRYLNQILYGSDPLDAVRQQSASVPIIIVRNEAGQKLALQVDGLAGSRVEVVVKSLGQQLSHIVGISGATIMGDGSVMLVLDLIALIRNSANVVRHEKAKASVSKVTKPTVLIVDDSVTVRKVTSRLLDRHGYQTQVAKDGVDALEKLQELTPDVILLDIEMPRMDGFEVASQVRYTSRLKDVPIIMITSRTGEKHRERALAIGVNDYMGKPFQEQQLLDSIARLVTKKSLN